MSKISENPEHRLYINEAELKFDLARFGDHLATRENYKAVSGMDAIHFYLAHKFHWFPASVRAMTSEDLRFLLIEEMHGWTLPKEFLD